MSRVGANGAAGGQRREPRQGPSLGRREAPGPSRPRPRPRPRPAGPGARAKRGLAGKPRSAGLAPARPPGGRGRRPDSLTTAWCRAEGAGLASRSTPASRRSGSSARPPRNRRRRRRHRPRLRAQQQHGSSGGARRAQVRHTPLAVRGSLRSSAPAAFSLAGEAVILRPSLAAIGRRVF